MSLAQRRKEAERQPENLPLEEHQQGHEQPAGIWEAVADGSVGRVGQILQDHPEQAAQVDQHTGRTLMHHAAATMVTRAETDRYLAHIMRMLVELGVDVHTVDFTGMDASRLLLLEQDDPDSVVHRFIWLAGALGHENPLHFAASLEAPDQDEFLAAILDILVNDAGYDVGARDSDGRTALQLLQHPERRAAAAARVEFLAGAE